MIRVAVNGFGRIGRVFTRVIQEFEEIELVAINDLTTPDILAHLFKYDSVHRKFQGTVDISKNSIIINGKAVKVFHEKQPNKLPWKELQIDVVIESTGIFRTKEDASKHLKAGARRVIISAPPKDDDIKTVVYGINNNILDGSEKIISNASCTTNAVAPLIQVLKQISIIDNAYITTVHSYTNDQRLHDSPHTDLRRARAGAQSIVPTTTGAAKAITKIFPDLDGKIGGCGIRVPVPNGSLIDISVTTKTSLTTNQINKSFKDAANTYLKQILAYSVEPLVSVDILGSSHSCIFEEDLTSVIGNMVKVVGWYDNESGYSNRLADLIIYWCKIGK